MKTEIKKGYKQTKVGIIPEDWEVKRINDLLENSYLGGNYDNTLEKEYIENKIPLIKMGNLSRGKIVLGQFYLINNEDEIDEKHLLHFNDVLFNTRNTLELVGKVAIWKNEYPKAYFNSNLLKLEFKESEIESMDFMNYQLNSYFALKSLKSVATGTTSVAAIYDRDLKKIKLPIPPKEEQTAIANCLSTWDAAIEKLTALIQAKKQQKKGLMQGIFNGKLSMVNGKLEKVEDESLWLKDWKEVRIGKLAKVYDGTHQTPKYLEEGIPFYSVEHLTADDFSKTKFITEEVFKKENERVKLEKGDVLMTRIGDIGTSKYIDWDVNASFYVTLVLFKKNSENINFRFLHHFISSHYFQNELHRKTLHVAFPKKINLGDIKLCKVLLPPLEEQTAIANILQTADKEIELLEQKLSIFQTQKKGLMQVLLTGEKRLMLNV